jgi:hypothetical protein
LDIMITSGILIDNCVIFFRPRQAFTAHRAGTIA